MKRWLAPLRGPVERVPYVAETYRLLRDYLAFRTATPRELPQGFRLMGDPKMVSGFYEAEATAVIDDALDSADVFIDVGANIGYYTCLARRRGRHVVAFEPSTTAQRFLYANLLANDFHDVEIMPLGLSDKIDLAVLYGTGGSASLVPGWSRASAAYATVIPTTTLDHALRGRFLERRLFVKIDVEGGELACLEGARETMQRAIAPAWFVEIYLDTGKGRHNPRFCDTFALFWDRGYVAREATRHGGAVGPAEVERWLAGDGAPAGANYLFNRPAAA